MMSLDQIASIQFLSQDVQNQLRSGVATPSVVQCVEELVVNSIDAEASCIAVRVHLPDCQIQVVDNGRGMTKDDMLCVGERYATSKCHDTKDLEDISHYGYRGEALASIKEISSVLEITSRARGSELTYSKLFHHGKDQGVTKALKDRPSGGTTVTARNVFYNLPVRRKMLSSPLVYEQICKQLQAISLIHPQISLTLRNDSTGVKSIQTHNSSSVVQTFGCLFGKDVAGGLKEVNNIHTVFNISGFIGSTSHRNKSLQFVYVNGRLILKTKIHKLVNELLSNSLVTKSKGKNQNMSQGYSMNAGPATCQPSPGGNQMAYGIFVLNITCCRNEYDITFDPAKTLVEFRDWEGVVTCVHELVTSFLERENLTMKVNVAQTGSEAGRSDLVVSNETEVCASAISTTDCKNAVQSTCVRRQIVQPDVTPMLNNLNPSNVERVEEDKADSHTTNNSCRIPDAFGDVNEIRETEILQPDSRDTVPQLELTSNKHVEEVLTAYASDHTDPITDPHCQLSHETLVNRPMPKTPDDKKVDNSQNMKSLTSNLSCNKEGSAAVSEAHWTSSSSELDVGSSEETLTSSEVEIGTPKSEVHQCCDARCLSMRRDDTYSGQKVVDLVSPRTRIAVKARNTLSMFRRSVKKKKMTNAAKDESSQKSEQRVNKHLQSASADEHKTIALRWYRSPGFRSTLESLNIKCKDRQEQVDVLQRLSFSSGPSQSNSHTNACSSEIGSSMKEACQSNQHAMADERSKLGNQAKTHMADDNNTTGRKVNEKEDACIVSIENQKCNPIEHMMPHDSVEQNTHDAAKGDCTKNTYKEPWESQRSDSNTSDLPRHSTMEPTGTRKIAADPPDSPISSKAWKQSSGCNLRERMKLYVQDSKGQLVDDAAKDICIESSSREHCERESIVVNTSYIPRNSTSESRPTAKRAADPPDSPVSSKLQKLTSGWRSSASVEVPVKFSTSTSFMVSACEVFDRETLQSSSLTDDCTQISSEELEQSISQGVRAASDDCQVPLPVQERPCPVPETEPFTVEIADGALDLCEIVNEKGTLSDNTTHWMEEDTTGINGRDITEMNEFDTMADRGQSAIRSFQTDYNDNKLKENTAEVNTDPGTYMDEDSGLLDASDPDDSISLFHIPHHDEERPFCLDTVAVASENRDDSTATKNEAQENSSPTEAPLSATSTTVHEGRNQFGINNDPAPIQQSCLEDIHSIKICGADENVPSAVEVPEIQVSSEGNPATESETRMCESSYTTQWENMDTKDSSGRNDPDGEFVIESREWYSVYDASRGRKIFINRFNGNCSSDKPEDLVLNRDSRQINEDHQFTMVTKNDTLAHPHLPHSAAPFVNNLRDKKESSSHSHHPPVTPTTLATVDAAMEESQEEDDELSIVKWGKTSQISRDGCMTNEGPQFSKYNKKGTGYGLLSPVSEGFPNVDVKFQAKVLASLNPCQFTKAMFTSMKVLGQLDKKFIACLVNSDYEKNPAGEPNLLILVDQHAAHERIRLEMLTQDAYTSHRDNPDDSDADQKRCIRTSDVTPALPISLSSSELRLLEAYPQKMKRIGIAYQLSEDSALVTRLPACVVEKEANELKRGRQTIATSVAETLIKEVLDSLQHQSGAVSSLPKTITRILNSQACHGAIKFGDTLDLAECKTLIGQLSSCDLPFQCAHGRPALMPILDFKKTKHANGKKVTPSPPQVWKLKYLTSGMNIQV
ncbi:uncharacterized protein LOC121418804 [Lytechinus variegatus]|uniref:uncharacterized protein LOC121418804 n=1 Tax=Lytechinus variegatus TaxID=7654 RepID=UPI001BB169AE|nr:uncharacterized protein LOC121418804 [Lytechinus variegatus]